jgi:cell wall-associated NlpC family hydrolase
MAAGFLIFYCLAPGAWAAPRPAAKPAVASCEVAQPEARQVKSKKKPNAAAKTKTSSRSQKKTKAVAQPSVSTKTKNKAEAITSEISMELPESLEDEIAKFFGLRYRLGGDGQRGFDCSGLIKQVYSEAFGINLPRTSNEQSRMGSLEPVAKEELKTGDLVFFGPNRRRVNHVGMYLASGHFLHASSTEGVTISRLDESYWSSRYMFSKRARGLGMFEDREESDLTQTLAQDSYHFTLGAGDQAEQFNYLEAGIQLNDSLEFLLSGFFLNAIEEPNPPPGSGLPNSLHPAEPSPTEGGFRLAAILSPLEWIKLIPSVTQVEEDKQEKNRDRDYQKFGLETWMFLPTSRVAVFMAAHARSEEDFFERPVAASPDWQTMDFALGLHYHLSDSLRFSLWGTQAYQPDLKANEDTGRRNATVEEVSFQFNLRF